MPWLKVRCWLSGRRDVEPVGVGEPLGIAVGRRQQGDDALARLDRRRHRPATGTVAVRPVRWTGPSKRSTPPPRRARATGRRRRRSHWSRWRSRATVPLPMRFVVVSWPATNSSTTVERSSSSESVSPSSSAASSAGEQVVARGWRGAPRRCR